MKILLLTSHYPANDLPKNLTSVVHYFAKEWLKHDIEIIVIHNLTIFPSPLYIFFKLFNKLLANRVGFFFAVKRHKELDYEIDGVKIYRRQILKPLPHFKFFNKSYDKQKDKIIDILSANTFSPDIIVGHWLTPQLKLISDLKYILGKPACVIVHEKSPIIERDYPKSWKNYIKNIDLIGYRSEAIKQKFEARYPIVEKTSFICYSGVPNFFLEGMLDKKFIKPFKIAFVGTLLQRKHPEVLLKALLELNTESEWVLNIVGEGPLKESLKTQISSNNSDDRIFLSGRLQRKKVKKILESTDIFVMISEDEAFGLVYLEAMALGCITIASRNEGMDGIIIDGINGFLCKAGNQSELQTILKIIFSMEKVRLNKISQNARNTAQRYSDQNVAFNYLQQLKHITSL